MKHLAPTLLALLLCVQTTTAQNLDLSLLQTINGWDSDAMISTSQFVSDAHMVMMVGVPSAMALYGLIVDDADLLESGVVIGTSVIASGLFTIGIKATVNRARPYDAYPDKITPYALESSASFPSGHTSTAFALATSLTLECPTWYVAVPSFAWASAVGYSRMNLGVHYPSDVVCGALLGVATSYLTYYVNKHWLQRQITKEPSSRSIRQRYGIPQTYKKHKR